MWKVTALLVIIQSFFCIQTTEDLIFVKFVGACDLVGMQGFSRVEGFETHVQPLLGFEMFDEDFKVAGFTAWESTSANGWFDGEWRHQKSKSSIHVKYHPYTSSVNLSTASPQIYEIYLNFLSEMGSLYTNDEHNTYSTFSYRSSGYVTSKSVYDGEITEINMQFVGDKAIVQGMIIYTINCQVKISP
jgi:hypothetical protein